MALAIVDIRCSIWVEVEGGLASSAIGRFGANREGGLLRVHALILVVGTGVYVSLAGIDRG